MSLIWAGSPTKIVKILLINQNLEIRQLQYLIYFNYIKFIYLVRFVGLKSLIFNTFNWCPEFDKSNRVEIGKVTYEKTQTKFLVIEFLIYYGQFLNSIFQNIIEIRKRKFDVSYGCNNCWEPYMKRRFAYWLEDKRD